jgi:hypothetical protein
VFQRQLADRFGPDRLALPRRNRQLGYGVVLSAARVAEAVWQSPIPAVQRVREEGVLDRGIAERTG